ncbi:uncharacterized protein LOC143913761 [Arctopsyche grandis]|uniref:uncharacterized protein LOC143913761 n=1 Tax=Arctopsyche grandis TaxID=121162 RepID=UPI00406D9956
MKLIRDNAALWCCLLCVQLSASAIIPESATPVINETVVSVSDETIPKLEESIVQNFTIDDEKCLSQKKFFIKDSCHSLLSQGPCLDGEWLVLDNNGDYSQLEKPIRPICKINPCEMNYIWWPDQNKCIQIRIAHASYCQDNAMVTIEPFGEGSCVCRNGFGMFENGSKCIEYYQQGRCKSSEVVTYDEISGHAVCTIDKCLHENMLHDEKLDTMVDDERRKIYAPMEGDGKCYKLFHSDPCLTAEFRFIVDHVSHIPKCIKMMQMRFAVNVVDRCSTKGNECRETISIRQKALKYNVDLNKLSRTTQSNLSKKLPK